MSGIAIKITAGSTQGTSSVHATGSLQHIITDEERATFGILDGDLKRKIGAVMGQEPGGVFVRSPTPWDDLYKTYGWDQIQTVLTPIEAKILSVHMAQTILSQKIFKNKSSKKATVTGKITEQVSNTAETSFSHNYSLSFNQQINYGLSILGGSTSFGFQGQWGKNRMESRTTTVGAEAGISVDLGPGEEVMAELSANSGRMKVRITYEAHLTGQTAVNYHPRYEGHYFYGIPISDCLGASNSVKVTEDIEIGYYSEVHVTIKNPEGKTMRCERC